MTEYSDTITNDLIAELPACRFPGNIVVVDTPDAVASAVAQLRSAGTIGFDTETRPTFKAGRLNRVALLQLSTDRVCYLFRLCAIGFDRELVALLEDRGIVKVGVDVKGDLRGLQQLRHFGPGGFVDLQSIVGNYGIMELSVRKMAAIVLGTRVSKAQRLSNWEAAELTPAQRLYAATDAWVVLEIYRKLGK